MTDYRGAQGSLGQLINPRQLARLNWIGPSITELGILWGVCPSCYNLISFETDSQKPPKFIICPHCKLGMDVEVVS